MLLFSTILDINDGFTKDAFIKLALDWNRRSPHSENVIPDMVWNGESSVHFGSDGLWMEILEYRNHDIVAIRYEKHTEDGVVWGTDFVMNFSEMKMSVRLDRSYSTEALIVDHNFTAPYFIRMLMDGGWLRDDNKLPTSYSPEYMYKDNIHILQKIISGENRYELPVVYVIKNQDGSYPLDVLNLAGRLKGAAHVLAMSDQRCIPDCQESCARQGKALGDVNICFPNPAFPDVHFFFRDYKDMDETLIEKTVRAVINYSLAQQTHPLYTWQGVNNALLRDRLASRSNELTQAKRQAQEADTLITSVDEEIETLKRQIEKLTRENDRLTAENVGLRSKISGLGTEPVLYLGNEDEFFPGEIKDILLSVLANALKGMKSSRRADVLRDIIDMNDYQELQSERAAELKIKMKGYTKMSGALWQYLTDFGFTITEDGKHYRLTYYGDPRYHTTLSKTSSDHREGTNAATTINRDML